jgi:hypothetical protein
MAKGATAKINVTKKIMEAFGSDFVTEQDKKLYVWADDGGEKVQVAISMTCPKTPVGTVDTTKINYGNASAGIDFESEDTVIAVSAPATEVTEEEKKNLENLLKELGL